MICDLHSLHGNYLTLKYPPCLTSSSSIPHSFPRADKNFLRCTLSPPMARNIWSACKLLLSRHPFVHLLVIVFRADIGILSQGELIRNTFCSPQASLRQKYSQRPFLRLPRCFLCRYRLQIGVGHRPYSSMARRDLWVPIFTGNWSKMGSLVDVLALSRGDLGWVVVHGSRGGPW